jgi:hypothetical protein
MPLPYPRTAAVLVLREMIVLLNQQRAQFGGDDVTEAASTVAAWLNTCAGESRAQLTIPDAVSAEINKASTQKGLEAGASQVDLGELEARGYQTKGLPPGFTGVLLEKGSEEYEIAEGYAAARRAGEVKRRPRTWTTGSVKRLFYRLCNRDSEEWRRLRPIVHEPEKVEQFLAEFHERRRKRKPSVTKPQVVAPDA